MDAFEKVAKDLYKGEQWQALVQHYIDGWREPQDVGPMPSRYALAAFFHPEAVGLVVNGDGSASLGPHERERLRESVRQCLPGMLSDRDRLRVLQAYVPDLLTPDALIGAIGAMLKGRTAKVANGTAEMLVRYVAERDGVAAGRDFLFRVISQVDSEDVHRGAIHAAVVDRLLASGDLFRLPPRIREYLQELTGFHHRGSHGPGEVVRDVMPGLPEETAEALLGLLNPTSVKLGANREDYSREEWAGICDHHAWIAPEWLLHVMELSMHVPHRFLAERLARILPRSVLGIPMGFVFSPLRLLHTKAILQTPTMSGRRSDQETPLVVELLQVISSDSVVVYDGSMRFSNRDLRAGVRRRYAEAVGEAMGVMFLEDAIGLDLSTLARIEESSIDQSPDFRAEARSGRVVVESKGASTWDYFNRSLAKAMRQVGKSGPRRDDAGRDRAFVCRTFVAQRDDERGSLLAVDDPPIDVGAFFGEREDDAALRRHFAGVCALAGYTDVARELTGAPPVRGEREARSERSRRESTLEVGGSAYVGVSYYLDELADLYGVEVPRWCGPLRIFRGIEQGLLGELRRGRVQARGFPARRYPVQESTERENGPASGVGIINSTQRQGIGSGVYSVVADGSMLAIMS